METGFEAARNTPLLICQNDQLCADLSMATGVAVCLHLLEPLHRSCVYATSACRDMRKGDANHAAGYFPITALCQSVNR